MDEPGSAPKYGRGTGVPNPIDVHVGGRIRMRRLLLGMNQETLANALGLDSLPDTPLRIAGEWPGEISAVMLDPRSTFDSLVTK